MRKIMALGLAGALATASVGVTAQSAQAGAPGFVAGVIVGVGAVALIHHFHHPYARAGGYARFSYAPGYGGDHVTWCKQHYRTYSIATDTYRGYDGYDHRCVSPH